MLATGKIAHATPTALLHPTGNMNQTFTLTLPSSWSLNNNASDTLPPSGCSSFASSVTSKKKRTRRRSISTASSEDEEVRHEGEGKLMNVDSTEAGINLAKEQGFQPLLQGRESKEAILYRYTLYQQSQQAVTDLIDAQVESVMKEWLDNIVNYICQPISVEIETEEHDERVHTDSIPTAVVRTGISHNDTMSFFQGIQSQVLDSGHCVIPLISEEVKSVENVMKLIMDALDFDDPNETSSSHRGSRSATMENVASLFLKKSDPSARKLVILIPDYQTFPHHVMQYLIHAFGNYRNRINFVFVLGISSFFDAIFQSLSKDYLPCLSFSAFSANMSERCMHTLVEKVFMDECSPIKFSPATLNYMVQSFDLCDMSVSNFKRNLLSALFAYYYTNPLSILSGLAHLDDEGRENVLSLLQPEHLQAIRMLSSFRNYIMCLTSDGEKIGYAKTLLTDDAVLVSGLISHIRNIFLYQHCFRVATQVFYQLQFFVKSKTFRKNLKAVFQLALEGSLMQHDYYKSLLILLGKVTIDECREILEGTLSILAESGPLSNTCRPAIEAFLSELEDAFEDSDEEDRVARKPCINDEQAAKERLCQKDIIRAAQVVLKQRTSRNSTQLKPIQESHRPGGWSEFLQRIRMFYADFFTKYLKVYTEIPLHEISYWNASHRLEKLFSPQPRAALHTALAYPKHYLNCSCCPESVDSVSVLASMPDTSILYHLYLECGKMINLANFFTSFCTVLEVEESDELQARFMLALSELELLGFIKKTSLKKDHVQRMTWGLM